MTTSYPHIDTRTLTRTQRAMLSTLQIMAGCVVDFRAEIATAIAAGDQDRQDRGRANLSTAHRLLTYHVRRLAPQLVPHAEPDAETLFALAAAMIADVEVLR